MANFLQQSSARVPTIKEIVAVAMTGLGQKSAEARNMEKLPNSSPPQFMRDETVPVASFRQFIRRTVDGGRIALPQMVMGMKSKVNCQGPRWPNKASKMPEVLIRAISQEITFLRSSLARYFRWSRGPNMDAPALRLKKRLNIWGETWNIF